MLNIINLYEGYIVIVHRMVTESRPVDPGSIQGSDRRISKHARTIFCVKLNEAVFRLQAKKPLHSGSYEQKGAKNKKSKHFSVPGISV